MTARRPLHLAADALVVVLAGLALGGATSYAQTWLPGSLAPLANSVSGWTLLTALAVASRRPGLRWGAVLGAASFVSLVLGYTAVSEARGWTYDPTLWGAVGVVAGPFVGAATAGLVGRPPLPRALGAGALAGVLVADGLRGLTVVADSTSPVYWSLCLAVGLLGLAAATTRLPTARHRLAAVATLAAAASTIGLGCATVLP